MLKRIPIILCVCLCFVLACAAPALAANLDYTDYISDVYVDGDNDVVKVDLPFDNAYSVVAEFDADNPAGSPIASGSGGSISWFATADMFYYIDTYPLGPALAGGDKLDLTNIPNGSILTVSFSCDLVASSGYGTPHHDAWIYYCDAANNVVGSTQNTAGTFPPGDKPAVVSFTLDKPSGAVSLYFCVQVDDLQANHSGKYIFTLESVDLELSISALYLQQVQTGKTNEILGEVEKQLEKNGQTLEEILQEQEKLPDKIGDEMQGIIDNEKEQSKGEGNKFVDQILDALPDPSQDVLTALKGLTDATAYNGTDAVLPIPALALPGIDGLFPATELWSGTDFDLGEYVRMLPSGLLTLVQSLFTIAIVLFCVYELKSIIGYCLTLRESKGG